MELLGVAWTLVSSLSIVVLMIHTCYCQKAKTETALEFVIMNYEVYETDCLNREIPFIFSIKIHKS